jgi:acetyl esterase/lipase
MFSISQLGRRCAVAVGMGLMSFAISVADAQVPAAGMPGVSVRSGIVYTQGVSEPLKADVYLPEGNGPFPGILFLHGGGWMNGNRYQMSKLIRDLAARGYVGFTIEYDVDPAPYPTSFEESLAALKYFRDHAAEFHLDPARIAVAGSSAGGELAALVALNPSGVTIPAWAVPSVGQKPVQGAIILNGVLDLTSLGDKSSMVTQYLGGACTSVAETCKDASPISHVHAGAPPFFLGHGTADETVPFAQAEAFAAALRAVKVPVRFFTAQGGPHTYWVKDAFYAKNLEDIDNFLALALRPPRTASAP